MRKNLKSEARNSKHETNPNVLIFKFSKPFLVIGILVIGKLFRLSIFGFRVFPSLFFSFLFCSTAWSFEDIKYDIRAKISAQNKTISADQTLSFKNNSGAPLKEIYLRVYPNHKYSQSEKRELYKYAAYFKVNLYPDGFDQGEFQIKDLKISGQPGQLAYSFEGADRTVMKIVLSEPLGPQEALQLDIAFSLRVPHRLGRYGWHKNTLALNRWYPLLSVLTKEGPPLRGETSPKAGWQNHPDYLLHMPYISEAASYKLTLELPADFAAVSGCDEILEEKVLADSKVIISQSSQPLRELSLALSRDYSVYETAHEGIKIKSFYFKKDEAQAQSAAQSAASLIKFYSKNLGPYPYKQFCIAPVYLGYGGSQNAGLIFIDSRMYQMPAFLARYFDFLVAHETGHQWWYNLAGSDEYRQLWLDEGINSYWIGRYLEDKYGPRAKIMEMPRWLEYFIPNLTFRGTRDARYSYFAKKGLDQPILRDISSFYEPSLIFTVAYGKGAAVLDMLEAYLGREKFSEIMRTYFQRYQFKNAGVEDFIRVCQEVSGQDLDWFFKDWLYGTKACDYRIGREQGRLVLKRSGDIPMPVKTRLVFIDGTEETLSFSGQNKTEVLASTHGKKIKEAGVDEDRFILETDRVNNHYPRLLEKKIVPVYHALYEMPVFLEDDRYYWITGPSLSQFGLGVKSSFQKPQDYILYAAAHYDFNAQSLISSTGFEKNNFLQRYMSWGVEFFRNHNEGLDSYKLYSRRELALGYSLFDLNSHITGYLLHNRGLSQGSFLGAREEARGLQYRKNKETIFGVSYFFSNAGTLPDPSLGYKLNAVQEIGGHALSGGDAFSRSELEFDKYQEISHGHKLALRLKAGAGHPKDKYLFFLGSDRELRGFNFKEIKGSSMLLGSLEYRFPLLSGMDLRSAYHLFSFESVQGVVFFDAGSAWFNRFNEPGFKKDAGLGLRLYFNVLGSAERLALRLDAARPLNGEDKDIHFWVGLNQAF